MHVRLLTIMFAWMLLPGAQAQKPDNLVSHYQNEYQTFKEFIKYGEAIQGDTNIDVKFYYIDIAIGVYSPYISGEVTILFEPVTPGLSEVMISLNSALTVGAVGSDASDFYQDNDVIVITLDGPYGPGELVEVMIQYEGVPVEAGGYKGLRYESHSGGEPVIATLSTPYLAHYWYPCKDGPEDKPDSVYMDITLPDIEISGVPLMGVSNGVLENIIDNGDTRTFQWRHRYPVVTYYVMAAVSNYLSFEETYTGTSGETFPLVYYVFQESYSSAQTGVSGLPAVMDFFSGVFGPYPFAAEKYGMTELGFYGAIENQTNTIQNNLSSAWFYTTIHELGHMWFGDMITLADWHHGWLNEGFATYSEALWDEHQYGFTGYKSNMATNEFWGGGTLYLQNAADTFNTFQPIFYSKGAYAVHMLRGVLGDELFFEALLNYAQDPQFKYKNASTEDLQASFESSSGMDLGFFFEQWIYDEYWPFYYYNFVQNTAYGLYVVLHQAQEELYNYRPVFEMPVRLKVLFTDATDTVITVWNDEQTQTFYFDLDKPVNTVQVDPDKWILRKTLWKPEIPVGEQEIPLEDEIQVFPNPFSGTLYIVLPQGSQKDFEIEIFNMQGQPVARLPRGLPGEGPGIVWNGKTDGGRQLPDGVYVIAFRSGGVQFSKRVVLRMN